MCIKNTLNCNRYAWLLQTVYNHGLLILVVHGITEKRWYNKNWYCIYFNLLIVLIQGSRYGLLLKVRVCMR